MSKAVSGKQSVDDEAVRMAKGLSEYVVAHGHQLGGKALARIASEALLVLSVKEGLAHARTKQATALPGGRRRRTTKSKGE